MMDLLSALISFFLTGPLQTELQEKLAAARVPQAIVTQVVRLRPGGRPRAPRQGALGALLGRHQRAGRLGGLFAARDDPRGGGARMPARHRCGAAVPGCGGGLLRRAMIS